MTPSGEDSAELLELIKQCRERNMDAWERFFKRYDHLVRTYVNAKARTTSPQDRDDMRQKVWIRMPAILERFDPAKGSLTNFLQRACQWAVLTEYRRYQRERQLEQPANEMILQMVRESPEEQNPALLRSAVRDYLRAKVNNRAKLLIYFDWIDGFSYRQVMARHGISRAVAFRRFEECRLLVRTALGLPKKTSRGETERHLPE